MQHVLKLKDEAFLIAIKVVHAPTSYSHRVDMQDDTIQRRLYPPAYKHDVERIEREMNMEKSSVN